MPDLIPMQTANTSNLDPSKLCRFDVEVTAAPTSPLIHQSARFLLINSGQGIIRIQNKDYELVPGAFVAISPWQISDVIQVTKPLQYYIVVYRFDIINQIMKSFYNVANDSLNIIEQMSRCPVVYYSGSQKERIQNIFLTIRDEMGMESTLEQLEPKYISGIYVTNSLVELVVLYLRAYRKKMPEADCPAPQVDRSEILQYMYHHISEKMTLKSLSQLFYMSESRISKYIYQVTGLPFFDLLNEMRVGKTISFLLYTDFTLEELAEVLGYVDASHISKVFSARMDMKVNEYRKTYQRISDVCKVKETQKAYAIVSHLYRNYSNSLNARSVADQFGISVQELHKILLYQVEQNFEDFLNYIRVNRASELLLTTQKSIVDIAVDVGYNSCKTLVRNFLKLRLISPSQFRKTVNLQPKFDHS